MANKKKPSTKPPVPTPAPADVVQETEQPKAEPVIDEPGQTGEVPPEASEQAESATENAEVPSETIATEEQKQSSEVVEQAGSQDLGEESKVKSDKDDAEDLGNLGEHNHIVKAKLNFRAKGVKYFKGDYVSEEVLLDDALMEELVSSNLIEIL